MSLILDEVKKLPVNDRIKLVENIWEGIEAETSEISLTPAQTAELQRRIEEYERNPTSGIPWEEVRDRWRERLLARGK